MANKHDVIKLRMAETIFAGRTELHPRTAAIELNREYHKHHYGHIRLPELEDILYKLGFVKTHQMVKGDHRIIWKPE